MAQRKSDRVQKSVQADAKARKWQEIMSRSDKISVSVRIASADYAALMEHFRKRGMTKTQGLRMVLTKYVDDMGLR